MFDLQPVGLRTLNDDHIEAADSVHPMPSGKILGCEFHQFGPFALINRQKGAAEGARGARLHFHKNKDTGVFRDQIQFTQGRPEVPLQDAIAFVAQ